MTVAVTAGLLVFGAVYLFMQREMLRVILGFVLLGHAANMVIMAAGGTSRRDEPFGAPESLATVADPLPQAFVLTAIVIAFSITIVLLVLAVTGEDHDDVEATALAVEDDGPDATHAPDDVDAPRAANAANAASDVVTDGEAASGARAEGTVGR